MAERYKKVDFDSFRDGESQELFSDKPGISFASQVSKNENGKAKIAPLFEKYEIANSYIYSTDDKIWGEYNDTGTVYFYIATQVATVDHAMLYSTTGAGAPTLRKDFGAGLPEQMMFAREHIIVQFINDTSGNLEWYWSKTPTVSGSWTMIAAMTGKLIYDWTRIKDTLYVAVASGSAAGKKSDIYISTDDGESFTLFQAGAPVQKLVESSGFLYGYCTKGDLYVLENTTWRLVDKAIGYGKLHDVGGLLRLYGFDHKVREFDGISMKVVRTLKINDRPNYIGGTPQESFFKVFQSDDSYIVYEHKKDGEIFPSASFPSMPDPDSPFGILTTTNDVRFVISNDDATFKIEIWSTYAGKYASLGTLQTTIIKDEMAPVQLTVRHAPLPAGTSVKVYYDLDQSGTYTLALTSDTDGAVKKTYRFAAGLKKDFARFKIELVTTDATKTPENVDLEFLYLPIGISNAQ